MNIRMLTQVVDFKKLTEIQLELLHIYMSNGFPEYIDQMNTYSTFHNSPPLQFPNSLIGRVNNKDEFVYDIVGDMIGEGGNGAVYEIIGKIKLCNGQVAVSFSDKKRVAKITLTQKKSVVDYVKNEYQMLHLSHHLPIKSLTFFRKHSDGRGLVSHAEMVMEHVHGETLLHIINNDALSLETRMTLSIQLIYAVRRLHKKGIIHCDIKPDNIIANLESSLPSLTIIDFGTCKFNNDGRHSVSITLSYAPPEWHEHIELSNKSDIYSLAWTLALLWGANQNPADTYIDEKIQKGVRFSNQDIYDLYRKQANHCKFENLFRGIDGLDKMHKRNINTVLNKMVSKRKKRFNIFEGDSLEKRLESRPDTDDVLNVFLSIQRDLIISQYNGSQISAVINAYEVGCDLHDKLDDVTIGMTVLSKNNLALIVNMIKNSLDQVNDEDFPISVFSSQLMQSTIFNAKSKQEIIRFLDLLNGRYIKSVHQLQELESKFTLLKKSLLINDDNAIASYECSRIRKNIKSLLTKDLFDLSLDTIHVRISKYEIKYKEWNDLYYRYFKMPEMTCDNKYVMS